MEFSACIKSSHHSLPSPDGLYIATLHSNHLHIYRTKTLQLYRTIILPPDFASRVSCIRWSRTTHHHPHISNSHSASTANPSQPQALHHLRNPQPQHPLQRILLADASNIRIYSLHNPEWTAAITHPTGNPNPEPSHIAFGHSPNDVLIFDAFGTRLKICFLDTGRSVEVRDPKISTLRHAHAHGHGHGDAYSYRQQTGHLALLTRPAAQDVVTLHVPGTYEVVGSFGVPVVDAQGVEWSADGRWVGMWEAAGAGYKVVVYTADGHLYQCYYGGGGSGGGGEGGGEGEVGGLGVRGIEWSPRGDYLAVAGYNGRVTLLGTTTFSPAIFLAHTPTIQFPRTRVWQEHISATARPSKQRSYVLATEPVCPPPPPASQPTSNPTHKPAVSLTAFNAPGTLLATRCDSTPSTIYIWSLSPLLRDPAAVLIQHSPVRTVQWHPTRRDLLLLHCANDEKLVYLWSAHWECPRIVTMPFEKRGSRHEVGWIYTPAERRPLMLCGDKGSCTVGCVVGAGDAAAEDEGLVGPHDELFDEGDSVDGARCREAFGDDTFDVADDLATRSWDLGGEVEDTFRFRKGVAS